MRRLDQPLSKAEVARLEQEIPREDSLPARLDLPTTYGSIEEAEERAFPWLRRRRRRGNRRSPFGR